MKLKTFFSPNVPSAMEEIRTLFGEDAIIVSAHRTDNKGVKLIVATEEKNTDKNLNQKLSDPKNQNRFSFFQEALKHHHLPNSFIERLVQNTQRKNSKTADERLITYAISETFNFKSIFPPQNNRIYILAGNAGSGKTLTALKMAFQAKKDKKKPALITLDTFKTGGSFELATAAQLMKIPCTVLKETKSLNETVTMMRLNADYIIIDTPALNPYLSLHLDRLKAIKQQITEAEMILTMQGGLETSEAITQGALFAKAGCSSLIATKLDCSKMYGSLLQTALNNQLSFAGFSLSGKVTDALVDATPISLTRLLCNPDLFEQEDDE